MGLGMALFCLRPAHLEYHIRIQQRTKDHHLLVLSTSFCVIGFVVHPVCIHIDPAHLGEPETQRALSGSRMGDLGRLDLTDR